jgi:hypothetical protein
MSVTPKGLGGHRLAGPLPLLLGAYTATMASLAFRMPSPAHQVGAFLPQARE